MRRNTKTMYEWRKAYRDKEELMLERGFPEVSPHEFYRDLFPEGSLHLLIKEATGKNFNPSQTITVEMNSFVNRGKPFRGDIGVAVYDVDEIGRASCRERV